MEDSKERKLMIMVDFEDGSYLMKVQNQNLTPIEILGILEALKIEPTRQLAQQNESRIIQPKGRLPN